MRKYCEKQIKFITVKLRVVGIYEKFSNAQLVKINDMEHQHNLLAYVNN